jgi:hypothetical protein
MLGKKDPSGGTAPVATGSAAVGSAAVTPPPPPPQPDPLPAMAQIAFDSNPKGALVVDAADPSIRYGKTPTTFSLPGSQTPRRFKFVLKGYGESAVELVPNRPTIEFKQELVKGATKADAVITRVPDPSHGAPKPDPAAGSAAKADPVLKADPNLTAPKPDPVPKSDPVVAHKPDAGVEAPRPDPAGKPKDDDCADDGLPCLKGDPSRK